MKGLLIILLVAVIAVFGQNYGNNNKFSERLGPEYPQPNPAVRIPKVDEVLPRLGAAAVDVDGVSYVFGGLSYLPTNWPAAFSEIEQLYEQYAVDEINAFDTELNKFVYTSAEGFKGLNHKRAFPVAQRVSENEFIVSGGGSDITEIFDVTTGEFTDVEITGYQPASTFAAASSFDYDHSIYVFGGLGAGGVFSQEVNVYDISTKTWTLLTITGDQPSGRYGSTFTAVEFNGFSGFLLYGGVTAEGLSDEFWLFDFVTLSWTLQNFNISFEAEDDGSLERAFHGVTYFEEGLVYFAGEFNGKEKIFYLAADPFLDTVIVYVPEYLNSYALLPVSSGFAYTINSNTGDVIVFSGVRPSNAVVETASLNAEVWAIYGGFSERLRCFPSFQFDNSINMCVQPSTDGCSMCSTCTDLKTYKKNYINSIKNKTIQRDYTGILKQCPAAWRNAHK